MNTGEFRDSINQENPPEKITGALAGLWWDAKGIWTKAHESAQEDESAAGAWVHAYLHRKEKDLSNAAYWYRQARKPVCKGSLEDEWNEIAAELLE
jgi:hypothetical protein